MNMRITIEINTTDGLVSPVENNILAHIVNQLHTENAPATAPVAEPETKEAPKRKRPARDKKEEPKHEEATTPPSAPSDGETAGMAAEKPAAKRTTTAKTPTNETVDAVEHPATPAKADAEKLAQATALASEMMQSGNVVQLKKLLVEVGANRVSKMTGEQVDKFLELANAGNEE